MFPFWNTLDPTTRARAQKHFEVTSRAWAAQIERFRREVEHVRVREIRGARHYVFLTDPGEVRHEMLDFLLAPPARSGATDSRWLGRPPVPSARQSLLLSPGGFVTLP